MPLDQTEAPTVALNVGRLFGLLFAALGKNSDGGKRITPAEWEHIGKEAGLVAAETVKDALD